MVRVCLQVRHGAGTGLREILKSHGAGGGKLVGSTAEQVSEASVRFCWWELVTTATVHYLV